MLKHDMQCCLLPPRDTDIVSMWSWAMERQLKDLSGKQRPSLATTSSTIFVSSSTSTDWGSPRPPLWDTMLRPTGKDLKPLGRRNNRDSLVCGKQFSILIHN